MTGTHYSMGFAVSEDGANVLLLEKNRPAFLAGQWMGLAGHIEKGETPLEAVRREAQEEGNINVEDWVELGVVRGQTNPEDLIYMFATKTDLSGAQALTDEPIAVFGWDEVDRLRLAQCTIEVLDRLKEFANGTAPLPRRGHKP